MALVFFVIVVTAFIGFFYGIGLRYLWFIPLLCCLGLVWYYTRLMPFQLQDTSFWQKHSLAIAWIAILAWIVSLLSFFLINDIYVALGVILLNWIGRSVSYLRSYKDGKYIFQLWYYLGIVYLAGFMLLNMPTAYILSGTTTLLAMHVGLMSFLVFVVHHSIPVPRNLQYNFFVTLIALVLSVLVQISNSSYTNIILAIGLLSACYGYMYYISLQKPVSDRVQKEVSIKEILAWERITSNPNIPHSTRIMSWLYDFVSTMPMLSRRLLEWYNVVLVLAAIAIYALEISGSGDIYVQLSYWIIIGLFVLNVVFLKYIWYTSTIQKIAVYGVINFAIYLTLFILFPQEWGNIVGRWIVWNILSGLLLFWIPETSLHMVLQRSDYYYRTGMTILAGFINIFLLTKTVLPLQLIISAILVYAGAQWIILYYAIKHIYAIQDE